jgi:hypothetical protein
VSEAVCGSSETISECQIEFCKAKRVLKIRKFCYSPRIFLYSTKQEY